MPKKALPIVSVIIPVKDTGIYLKRCLDSIVHQTIKGIEIIVVDDASKQDITTYLEEYKSDNITMVYLRNEISLGPGGARNKGINNAKGEFIAFIDSDDWIDLNLLEVSIARMRQTDADIGMVSVVREYPVPNKEKIFKCKYNQEYNLTGDMALRILTREYSLEFSVGFYTTNKIYKTQFLLDNNIKFDENIYFQSAPFTIHTFLYTNQILCIPAVQYHHYRRTNSVVQSFDQKHIDDYQTSMCSIKQRMLNSGKYDDYCFHYYKICERYLNVLVKEIFMFIPDEDEKKFFLIKLLNVLPSFCNVDEYFEYSTAEQLRHHIQPAIDKPELV